MSAVGPPPPPSGSVSQQQASPLETAVATAIKNLTPVEESGIDLSRSTNVRLVIEEITRQALHATEEIKQTWSMQAQNDLVIAISHAASALEDVLQAAVSHSGIDAATQAVSSGATVPAPPSSASAAAASPSDSGTLTLRPTGSSVVDAASAMRTSSYRVAALHRLSQGVPYITSMGRGPSGQGNGRAGWVAYWCRVVLFARRRGLLRNSLRKKALEVNLSQEATQAVLDCVDQTPLTVFDAICHVEANALSEFIKASKKTRKGLAHKSKRLVPKELRKIFPETPVTTKIAREMRQRRGKRAAASDNIDETERKRARAETTEPYAAAASALGFLGTIFDINEIEGAKIAEFFDKIAEVAHVSPRELIAEARLRAKELRAAQPSAAPPEWTNEETREVFDDLTNAVYTATQPDEDGESSSVTDVLRHDRAVRDALKGLKIAISHDSAQRALRARGADTGALAGTAGSADASASAADGISGSRATRSEMLSLPPPPPPVSAVAPAPVAAGTPLALDATGVVLSSSSASKWSWGKVLGADPNYAGTVQIQLEGAEQIGAVPPERLYVWHAADENSRGRLVELALLLAQKTGSQY